MSDDEPEYDEVEIEIAEVPHARAASIVGLIRTARISSVVSLLIATVFTVVLVIVLALIAGR